MKNQTQKKWVLERLQARGYITRNECLQNYISRLGAIICDLKKEGYEIVGKNLKTEKGVDYIYKLSEKQGILF